MASKVTRFPQPLHKPIPFVFAFHVAETHADVEKRLALRDAEMAYVLGFPDRICAPRIQLRSWVDVLALQRFVGTESGFDRLTPFTSVFINRFGDGWHFEIVPDIPTKAASKRSSFFVGVIFPVSHSVAMAVLES